MEKSGTYTKSEEGLSVKLWSNLGNVAWRGVAVGAGRWEEGEDTCVSLPVAHTWAGLPIIVLFLADLRWFWTRIKHSKLIPQVFSANTTLMRICGTWWNWLENGDRDWVGVLNARLVPCWWANIEDRWLLALRNTPIEVGGGYLLIILIRSDQLINMRY